jgi:predicted alpha/beta-hydrolase family hydrolase
VLLQQEGTVDAETFHFVVNGGASSRADVSGDASSRVSARLYRAAKARAALVLAHGAGAPQTHPWIVRMATAVAARGVDVVTFNFLYSEARRRVPDKNDVLEATWRAAIEAVRARPHVAHGRLLIGGKSMGGRIATQVAALAADAKRPEDAVGELAGLVLLGYPLHPPGKPEKLRSAHLGRVQAPMLFVQGERDAFGTPAELEPFVAPLRSRGTRLFPVADSDHSLVPPKRSGMTLDTVIDAVAAEIADFAARVTA